MPHPAGQRHPVAGELDQRPLRQVRSGDPRGALRRCPAAPHCDLGHPAGREARRTPQPLQPPAAGEDRRGVVPRRAGHSVSEPARILPFVTCPPADGPHGVPIAMSPLPITRGRTARLPLLRPCGADALRLPRVRGGGVVPAGFGTEKVEEEIGRLFSRGALPAHGPRQHPVAERFPAHGERLRAGRGRYSDRHADGNQGVRLRPGVAGGDSQCRQSALQPRFPGFGAGFPTDDAGGGGVPGAARRRARWLFRPPIRTTP